MVNAVRTKKSPEEILAERLKNLELARATKALYRLQREEAAAGGESVEPPRSKPRSKTLVVGKPVSTTPLDMSEVLDHLKVEVPLKQLLYHAPELHAECGILLGYTAERGTIQTRMGTAASKWNPENQMDIDTDKVTHLSLDTSLGVSTPVSLQAVCVAVGDQILDFLIDGGAMISLIPLQVVRDLGQVRDIQPTDRLIRFGDGVAEMPVGVVKLQLTLSKDVEIWHHFCVTKTSKTPLILGMDFLKQSGCRPDIKNQVLKFSTENGRVYQVETHDGDGLLNPGITPPGVKAEDDEPLVIPVMVSPNAMNRKLLDVQLEVDWMLNPAETTVMELHTEAQSKEWSTDKVLQPVPGLWNKGIYVMPVQLNKAAEGTSKHTVVLLNLDEFEAVMAYLTAVYSNVDLYEEGPSIFEGPVYVPQIYKTQGPQQVYHINTATCEPPLSLQFDINKELSPTQQAQLAEVLNRYSSVFATSLKQVGKLKVDPYEIKIKEDAVPVKVPPRMIPHAANEWFKEYISQLLELGLIEPCTGPWAAAVVLVPSNADDRAPRKRRVKPMKTSPKIQLNPNTKPVGVYSMRTEEIQKTKEPGLDDSYELLTQSWSESKIEPVQFRVQDASGIAQEVTSTTPPREAGKKDPYRVCVNYKPVNKVMLDSGYPIPNINFLFTLLKDARYYALYDCLKGFWQLPLAENSRDLSGFSCSMGQFRWTRLPMGMKLSPLAWQAQMDAIFFDDLLKSFLCYIDDGLTFSRTFSDHLVHVETILKKAQKAGLSLSISKCKFGYDQVKLLGYIVSRAGLQMDPGKTLRILEWPPPRNVSELNRFIGVIQYYRRFIPNLSEMLSCMNDLKKKDVRFQWTKDHAMQFKRCKQALIRDPIMRHPDFNKKFILLCDASNVAIGGVLAQESEEDKNTLHPIFFGSKALSSAERKISTYEKEFLAIVYFIHFYKQYLMGNRFTVYTDQKCLQYLIKFSDDASAKVVRWQGSLMAYDFDIIYKAGKLNVHADAMSRLPSELPPEQEADAVIADYYLPLNVVRKEPDDGFEVEDNRNVKKGKLPEDDLTWGQIVGNAGMKQDYYDALRNYLTLWKYPDDYGKKSRKALRNVAKLYTVKEGELYKKATKEDDIDRKVIPTKQVVQILRECHDHVLSGHQGIKATYQRVKQQYYWPGYYDTVREYVQSCKVCQGFGIANRKLPLHIVENRVDGAFAKIGIDYIYAPKTSQGHGGALVIIDYLTAWIHAEPVSTQSASSTCLGLFKWICQYGCPSQIIADNGSHFNAQELKEYMANTYDIKLHFGSPYRPQRQGKVERANRTLKDILKKYVAEYVTEWDIFLPAALFVMRTMWKIDGTYSPFILTYGRPPRISALENEDVLSMEETDEAQLLTRIREIIRLHQEVIPGAINKMNVYKIKMKKYYDKNAREKRFRVGDKVMLIDYTGASNGDTFVPRWIGPFSIKDKKTKDTYILQDELLTLPHHYHGDQLKLYRLRPKIYLPVNFGKMFNGG